ncbi:hypothetical protein NDU88_005716 [Pleurodeles waltl]|uniref:Uncharacterized protein n=1 Tax=Pleurodeles waltl TaxID=8319 RepID=A0AAV7TBJ9_PLEWA|nr:hypothetical protein NDU88_005716 [Pleurodeles waltl]
MGHGPKQSRLGLDAAYPWCGLHATAVAWQSYEGLAEAPWPASESGGRPGCRDLYWGHPGGGRVVPCHLELQDRGWIGPVVPDGYDASRWEAGSGPDVYFRCLTETAGPCEPL